MPSSSRAGTAVAGVVLWLALLAGLTLSILSGLKICTALCSETAKYTIFGMDFGWFGCLFFGVLILGAALRRRVPLAGTLLLYGVAGAAGAELRLIWIQKYVIGAWCPVCLGIAAMVATAGLALIYELLVTHTALGGSMKTRCTHIAVMILALLIGLGAAVAGVQKEAEAAGPDIYFGKRQSDTTVYVVSDWFCPVCRKVEPEIEKAFPEIAAAARVAFVDMPIHPDTSNYTPFNLQFIVYNKDKYMRLRHVLDELSRSTKSPTPEQVQAAVAPLGITLRPHNFVEIMNGVKLFESIFRGFGVKATPTVVIDNPRTKKRKLLIGSREITRNAIKEAIAEVGR
ncbi:thioredoxin domain-containing protein [Geobacter sp. FeAm09]|uniref:vitamin K epoxide reductase family protein n=1 Tax=Geobacter sp. FeAm09 TaxID=2597769 RepID=UPI001F0E7A48|nr:thioredoxin domain-containing protein [Geobacter sp. FeAm09]